MAEGLGPFYDLERAAEYCGYSASYFAKIIKKFSFKRYGPSKSRFARADLDRFMADPAGFRIVDRQKLRIPIEIEV